MGGGGPSFFAGSVGGGIDNFGGASLTVTGSTFAGNQALGAAAGNFGIGGAIENNAGDRPVQPLDGDHHRLRLHRQPGRRALLGNGGAMDNEGPEATMTLSNSLLIANESGGQSAGDDGIGGGLMNFAGSTSTVVNSAFIGNLAVAGGGQAKQRRRHRKPVGGMTISDSTVIGNQSVGGAGADGVTTSGEGLGGGIMNVFGATMTILDSTISRESGHRRGQRDAHRHRTAHRRRPGRRHREPYRSTLTIVSSTVAGNVARGGSSNAGVGGSALGGGIQNSSGAGEWVGGSTLALIDTTVADNSALGGSGASGFRGGLGGGGGLDDSTDPAPAASTASIIGSTFTGNQAVGGDGGFGANGGNGVGGGISVGPDSLLFSGYPDPSALAMTNSTVGHNTALGGDGGKGGNGGDGLGGGLAIQAGANATVSDSTITHNQALGGKKGGGGQRRPGRGRRRLRPRGTRHRRRERRQEERGLHQQRRHLPVRRAKGPVRPGARREPHRQAAGLAPAVRTAGASPAARYTNLECALNGLVDVSHVGRGELIGRAVEDDSAGAQPEDAVGEAARQLDLVQVAQHGQPPLPAQRAEQVEDEVGVLRVETGDRFVGQQEAARCIRARATATRCCWPPDRRSPRWNAWSSSRTRSSAASASTSSGRGYSPSVQRHSGSSRNRPARQFVSGSAPAHQVELLPHQRDARPRRLQNAPWARRQVVPVEADGAARRPHQPQQAAQQRWFCPRRSAPGRR